MAARTALAAVLAAALVGGSEAGLEGLRGDEGGCISVAHAAVASSSAVAEPQVARAPVQLRASFIAISQPALEPACARRLPAAVAPDAQPLRPDVVTCPAQGPPRAG